MSPSSSMPFGHVLQHIAGRWRPGASSRIRQVVDPANAQVLATFSEATPEDVREAVEAAHAAFPDWSSRSAASRAECLHRAADRLEGNARAIGMTLVAESGKPMAEAEEEVRVAAQIFRWCAEEGRRAYGRIVPGRDPRLLGMVLVQPHGPVAAFTPWNFPALTPARKIAGALAAGCTLVLKPAEETPATAVALVQACLDAGVPPGAVNLVLGDPPAISEQLIRDPRIRKVSLTGSVAAGRAVGRLAGETIKPVTLELGGHAPFVVWHDADLDAAVHWAVLTKFRNAGQVCVASSRFFVHERVHAEFSRRLAQAVAALEVGDPRDPRTRIGPMSGERGVRRFLDLVDDARERGARVLTGGRRLDRPGFFVEPCVLDEVPGDARVMHEEPFAPVAPIAAVGTLDEAIGRANELPFGLAAYAFTRSEAVAQRLQREIRSGMLAINHGVIASPEVPFGGTGDSGLGSEGGIEGLQAYLQTRYVSRGPLEVGDHG